MRNCYILLSFMPYSYSYEYENLVPLVVLLVSGWLYLFTTGKEWSMSTRAWLIVMAAFAAGWSLCYLAEVLRDVLWGYVSVSC